MDITNPQRVDKKCAREKGVQMKCEVPFWHARLETKKNTTTTNHYQSKTSKKICMRIHQTRLLNKKCNIHLSKLRSIMSCVAF